MTPRMPLMPRERRNRPERHVFETDLFPLPRMDAAALLADMKSSVAIEMAELDLCGETPWDGIEGRLAIHMVDVYMLRKLTSSTRWNSGNYSRPC